MTNCATRLLDVAKAAGVSRSTASNVFTNPERVRAELKDRVKAAARTLGYGGPDPKGRLLRAGKFDAIGVMPSGAFGVSAVFRDPWMRLFMTGVADACEEQGVGLSLVSGREDQKSGGVRQALVDGFILFSLEEAKLVERAKHRKVPVVLIGEADDHDVSSVSIENRDGMRQAARHLIALGHRRFGILDTP